MKNSVKAAAASGFAFSATMIGTFVAYAAISSVWTNTAGFEASNWTPLSSATWNQLVWNVQQLKDTSGSAGTIAGIKAQQTRTQWTYTAPTSGNGIAITPLDITYTPKKAGNMVILEWNFSWEWQHDTVFVVTRNGVLLPDSVDGSNNRYSWITSQDYDQDYNSTPNEKVIRIIDFNSLAGASTYSLLVRSTDGNTRSFYLNRSIGSAGTDVYETGMSTVTATEVYQ